MEKLTYKRDSEFLWFGEKKDVVHIKNLVNREMLFQIRVNGYLHGVIYMFPLGKKQYFLTEGVPHSAEVTVLDIEEEIDLTLPQNSHQRDEEFFREIGDKYFKL
ncbi:hypothetical protein ACS6Z0_07360 [Streptococcus suis]